MNIRRRFKSYINVDWHMHMYFCKYIFIDLIMNRNYFEYLKSVKKKMFNNFIDTHHIHTCISMHTHFECIVVYFLLVDYGYSRMAVSDRMKPPFCSQLLRRANWISSNFSWTVGPISRLGTRYEAYNKVLFKKTNRNQWGRWIYTLCTYVSIYMV